MNETIVNVVRMPYEKVHVTLKCGHVVMFDRTVDSHSLKAGDVTACPFCSNPPRKGAAR